jgi:hypothetical protein
VHSAAAHWLSMQPGRDAERAEHYQLSAMHHHILKKATRYQDSP